MNLSLIFTLNHIILFSFEYVCLYGFSLLNKLSIDLYNVTCIVTLFMHIFCYF